MSFVSLVFGQGHSEIGSVPLDALLTEDTNLTSTVTDYPVEDGTHISDHISRNPELLSLSGVITGASVVVFGSGGRSKLVAAKDQLRALHDAAEPITVTTGMDVYDQFAIESLDIRRDAGSVQYHVDCQLKHIRKVTLQKSEIPPEVVAANEPVQGVPDSQNTQPTGKGTGANGRAGTTQNNGHVEPQTEQITSDLAELMQSVGGIF